MRARLTARAWLALASSAVLCIPRMAAAYRPFDATDGDVAQTGEFELELGPLQYAQEGKEKFFLTPTVLNLGLIPRTELVVDFVPLYPLSGGRTQLTGTDVFAKYLLRCGALQGETGPSVAVEGGPLLPEVNGRNGFGASLKLIVSDQFGWLTLHLNNEGELSRRDLVFGYAANLIGEFDIGSKLRPVAELGFELEPSSGAKGYSALAGVIWRVAEQLAMDAAARVGRLEDTYTFEARLGLTWTLPVWSAAGNVSEPGAPLERGVHLLTDRSK